MLARVTARNSDVSRLPQVCGWVTAMALLAACKPTADTGSATQQATAHATEVSRSRQREGVSMEVLPGMPIGPAVVLAPEALQARVIAQKALLPDHALFEDGSGKPIPWISAADHVIEPLIDDDLLTQLPGSSGLGGPSQIVQGPRANGNALGLFEPLEQPTEGSALGRFYAALKRLEAGDDEDGKVRVLVYGASHTEADVYPHYLRTYLQERFGDGGHGFVHVAKPWRWYGHVDVEVDGFRYWKTEHAQYQKNREDGFFGLMGASLATKRNKAFGRVTPRRGAVAGHFEVYYLKQPKGGSFQIVVDGKVAKTVKTRAARVGPGYFAFERPEEQHTVEIRPLGNGEVRLFGMTMERDSPGVVVDTLGIGGTRAANLLKWDSEVWADNVRHRDPSLVILAYGTNEATDERSISTYETQLREVVARVQAAAPDASCLLVGPGDFPQRVDDAAWAMRPRVRGIIDVQSRVASDMGCGFWDTLTFMGGELSMVTWVNANPPMAKEDHVHLTRRGYVRMGMALTDAMMADFDGINDLDQPAHVLTASTRPAAEPSTAMP